MGGRINTIMQTCFFAICGVLPREEAIDTIKHAIKKTYGKRGESVVKKNFAAVDASLATCTKCKVPAAVSSTFDIRPAVPAEAPGFRAEGHRQDAHGRRRRSAGERHANRRHVPHRYRAVGEAQYRA